jgi:predicted MarR family transcription regulator
VTGVDLAERLLIDKIASHTATQDDVSELAALLWRRLHPEATEGLVAP